MSAPTPCGSRWRRRPGRWTRVLSVHDLRITAGPYHTNVLFDVMVPYGFRLTDAQVTRELRQAVEALSEKYSAVIQVDHSYVERREDV